MHLNRGHIIFICFCFIAGIILGMSMRSCHRATALQVHDTVTVHDTVRLQAKTKILYRTTHDTMLIARHDTVTDTILVHIPIEHKQYNDTITTDSSRIEVGIRFSGYRARLDSVGINYQLTKESAPQTKTRLNKWGQFIGVGIGVGYGASVIGRQVFAAPEIGLHITYGWGYRW